MRMETFIRKSLGMEAHFVVQVEELPDGGLRAQVDRLPGRRLHCGECGLPAAKVAKTRRPERRWRDLQLREEVLWLAYAPHRVWCPTRGLRVEQIPWADKWQRVTHPLFRAVALLARKLDWTAVAAHCNATVVNFTNVANDAQVKRTTVYEYFRILQDTLILHEVPAWRKTIKRKPLASSKFYFFDVGVVGILQGRLFRPSTPEFGEAFETFLLPELISYRDYRGGGPITYWGSQSGFEVDFIMGDHTAIEPKAKTAIFSHDLRSLEALAEESRMKRFLCVSLEPRRRTVGKITVLPYRSFLHELWSDIYRS